jgi:hypothetical protein
MPPQTARSRTRSTHAATRSRPRPAPARPTARRVSGPLRPAPAHAGAGAAVRRGSTGVFERIRALPETRVVDGLLRGRVWIWLIGLLLGGIVAMQVSLLKLNSGISRAVTTIGTLERQNAGFEAEITRASSGERVRAAAADKGLITPAAGEVGYLRARPERDAQRAARRIVPPSDEALAIMQNFGREPGVLAAAEVLTSPVVPAPTEATTTTTDPAVVATPETVTPVATPDPAAVTQATDTGAATVPEG